MWPVIVLLAACTAPDGPPATSEDTAGDPYFDVDPLTAQLGVDEVDAEVEALLAERLFLALDFHAWFAEVFADLVAGEDVRCPEAEPGEVNPDTWTSDWGGSCAGARYALSGDWQAVVTQTYTDQGNTLNSNVLTSLHGEVVGDGGQVASGGQGITEWSATRDAAELMLSYKGSMVDASEGGPAGLGVSIGLEVIGTYTRAEGFEGTVEGPIGGGSDGALSLDALVFTAGCAGPTGAVALRDPSSGWWTVGLADDCSGCGPLTFGGVEMGTSCAGALVAEALDARLAAALDTPP